MNKLADDRRQEHNCVKLLSWALSSRVQYWNSGQKIYNYWRVQSLVPGCFCLLPFVVAEKYLSLIKSWHEIMSKEDKCIYVQVGWTQWTHYCASAACQTHITTETGDSKTCICRLFTDSKLGKLCFENRQIFGFKKLGYKNVDSSWKLCWKLIKCCQAKTGQF